MTSSADQDEVFPTSAIPLLCMIAGKTEDYLLALDALRHLCVVGYKSFAHTLLLREEKQALNSGAKTLSDDRRVPSPYNEANSPTSRALRKTHHRRNKHTMKYVTSKYKMLSTDSANLKLSRE